jgi:arylformamidase
MTQHAGSMAALREARGAAAPEPETATRPKGPPVWLDMDQQALDDAYDQAKYAPNRDQVLRRNAANSELARARLGGPQRFAYGPTPVEALDVYAAERTPAPVNVFIHGGAWRQRWAKDFGFMAELFVNAGAHFVALDFTGIETTAGDLAPIADQVRRAVAWVYTNAARFGGNPNRLYVCGQSSGAHLGGVVLTTDWPKDFGLPADVVKGGVLCSGMYDLEPVRLSARSNYVKFTDTVEQALSSQRHLDKLNCPVTLVHGTCETPEFQRQSRDFAAAVKAAGKPVKLVVAEGYNHFEIAETFANPYGPCGRAVLEQMGLRPA